MGALTKKIMRKFTIFEVSGVRVPAQEGATVAIIKSKAAEPTPREEPVMAQAQQQFTKAEVGDALDTWAKAYSTANQVSFVKAYDEVLKTDMGAQLYAMSRIVKAAPSLSKGAAISDALEALAKQRASLDGTTVAKAMAALLETEAGRALYSGMRAAV